MYDVRGYLPYASVREILADWERPSGAWRPLPLTWRLPGPPAVHRAAGDLSARPSGRRCRRRDSCSRRAPTTASTSSRWRWRTASAAPGHSAEELAAQAAADIDERKAHGEPYVWTGVSSSVSGAYDDVVLPSGWTDHDWELELGVVIGRKARHVPAGQRPGVRRRLYHLQ